MNVVRETNYTFPSQIGFYRGKVRDVYFFEKNLLVMITSDRVSAFDVVMPRGIPYKGQVLNQIALRFMEQTSDILPNWIIASPDPNVIVGKKCIPFKVEMVIRGYLSGHAAREYHSGKRMLCGERLSEGLKENDRLEKPIITPTTKADLGGHDQDISRDEILRKNLVSEENYAKLEDYTNKLFQRGTEIAAKRGLILVDTKYEFGKTPNGEIVLIDEIHTPDSSRYFYLDSYNELQQQGLPQLQLSKEFFRQWLIEHGFQGKSGQKIPQLSDEYILTVSNRYIELYEKIMGEPFQRTSLENITDRIEKNINQYLNK